MSKLRLIWTMSLILAMSGCSVQEDMAARNIAPALSSVGEQNAIQGGPAFPRLGMWWLDPSIASISEMGRYDFLLDSFEGDELKLKQKELQAQYPLQINLKPLSPSERSLFWEDWDTGNSYPNPEIRHLPTSFFLLQTGARLLAPLNETDEVIKLDRTLDSDGRALFHVGGEVAIGNYESAHVIGIDTTNNQLTVERGYVRQASAHGVGEAVASHIRFWPGSWVMNVTDACPREVVVGVKTPVNWIEYYFKLTQGDVTDIYVDPSDNWDGIEDGAVYEGFVIDRFEDKESWLKWVLEDEEITLDLRHNNEAVSVEVFDESWKKGTDQLYDLLHEAYPTALIIRNNPLTLSRGSYNGQVFETGGWTSPTTQWWEQLVVAHDPEDYYQGLAYLEWFTATAEKPLVLFEVYEDEGSPEADASDGYDNPMQKSGFVPNYQRMRFSLASALLGDGYYAYEINTEGHGALGLLWFDEYDNGGQGKGYLGYPTTAYSKEANGLYTRAFEHGLVLVNPTDNPLTIQLKEGYRRIKGKQVPDINSGEPVSQVTLNAYDGLILVK